MFSFFNTLAVHPIVLLFLLANIFIGFWAYSRNRVDHFEDYAFASRKLSTGVLLMTLLGTFLSAGHFAFVGWVAKYGIMLVLPVLVIMSACLIVGTFFVPYLVDFKEMSTTGEIMGSMYGSFAQFATGIFGGIFSLILLSGQLRMIGRISAHFLGADPGTVILCVGAIVVLYSTLGGMKAVSYTDVFQMLIATSMIFVVVHATMREVGGVNALFAGLPTAQTALVGHPDFWVYLRFVCFRWLIPTSLLTPAIMQRMLATPPKHIKKTWYIGAFLLPLIFVMMLLVTLSSFAMGIKVNISDREAVTTLFLMVVKGLSSDQWFLDFAYIGMLAVAIATFDSYCHALGISFVQDFIVPVRRYLGWEPLENKHKTRWSQCSTFIMGSLAVLVGYLHGAGLAFNDLWHLSVFVSPMVLVPLIIGIVGLKTHRSSWLSFCFAYLIAMSSLYVTGVLYDGKGGVHMNAYLQDCVVLASCIGLLAYFLMHLYLHGRIVMVKRAQQVTSRQRWSYMPFHVPILIRASVAKTSSQAVNFSIIMLMVYTIGSVLTQGRDEGMVSLMMMLFGLGAFLCCGLMLVSRWPAGLKPHFSLYWVITLWYCLPFGSTLFFLQAPEETWVIMLWIGSLMLLSYTVDATSFMTLSFLGVAAALGSWKLWVGPMPMIVWNSVHSIAIFALAMVVLGNLSLEHQKKG